MIKQVNNCLTRYPRTGWRWLAGLLLCTLTPAVRAQTQTFGNPILNRCGIVDYERLLQRRNPDRLRLLNELNQRIQQVEENRKAGRQQADTTIYRIPIVVHVVHNTASGAVGGAGNGNISEAQISSQIQVLNEDYRRRLGTNGYNPNSPGTDARIEFYLATTDPDGNATNGITRHYYPQQTSFDVTSNDDLLLSQIAYWPSNRYLNIWVTSLQGNNIGYTAFPTRADTLSGLPTGTDERVDGSFIDHRVFGRQGATNTDSRYALGRTVTHEIGHWLGLFHVWGDGGGCNEDYVADTPPMEDGSTSPQSCRQTFSNCNGRGQVRDLMENYMNYWPDACMNMFTAGQVGRMRAVLALSPRRAQLLKSVAQPLAETNALTINVYPNPTTSDPSVDVQLKGFQSFTVDLFDATGRQLRTLSYTDSPSARVTLAVSGLTTGMYIVRVKTDTETVSKRLLVQ